MSDLQGIAEQIVGRARPGEQLEAYVARGGETTVSVYGGNIEKFISAESAGVGVRIIRDGRTGFASAGTLDQEAIDDVVAEARDNVQFGTVDEWAGLAEPDGVDVTPQVLWNGELEALATDTKIDYAERLEQLALADSRVRVHSADYEDGWGEAAIVSTTGVRRVTRGNGCYVQIVTLADDDGESQMGFGFSVGRGPSELDIEKAAADGVDRATRLLGAKKPPSRRVTVVLDPYVSSQFLGIIGSTLNGESVVKGRSLFRDRLGETVASDRVTLVDDPTNPLAFTASEADGEGLATRRNMLIDGGELQQFVHSSYSARRAKTSSTGNAVRGGYAGGTGTGCIALQLAPGLRQQAEIVASIDDGVLIQSVSGLHSGVNVVSGDFSTGASGVLISGGQLGGPVKEFTIASTLQRMLLDLDEVGADVEWLPMGAAGVTLVIHDVMMSGA